MTTCSKREAPAGLPAASSLAATCSHAAEQQTARGVRCEMGGCNSRDCGERGGGLAATVGPTVYLRDLLLQSGHELLDLRLERAEDEGFVVLHHHLDVLDAKQDGLLPRREGGLNLIGVRRVDDAQIPQRQAQLVGQLLLQDLRGGDAARRLDADRRQGCTLGGKRRGHGGAGAQRRRPRAGGPGQLRPAQHLLRGAGQRQQQQRGEAHPVQFPRHDLGLNVEVGCGCGGLHQKTVLLGCVTFYIDSSQKYSVKVTDTQRPNERTKTDTHTR